MQGIVVAAPGGIVASVSLAACAALALGWAWRGRAAGDERRACRWCGGRLSGPLVSECPDCGADVSRPHAVHVTHGRRRPVVAAAAVAVILLCMAWLVAATFSGSRLSAGATDLVGHTPTSWLITDAGGADARKRDVALAELARRVAKGELTPPWVQALVGRALEEQANWQRPWAAGWGDVVEAARTAGQLSDAQWTRYQVQSLSFIVEPEKETLRRDDSLVLNLFRGPDRLSSRRPSFPLAVEPEGQISVAGRTVAYAKGGTEPVVLVAGRSAGPGRRFASMAPIDLRRQPALVNLAGGSQRVTIGLVVRPVRTESPDGQDADQLVALPQGRRVEVAGRFVLRDELPLDELVTPEWKGVWAPPAQKEVLLRAEAKRKAAQHERSAP
jgi:hypothetical protein